MIQLALDQAQHVLFAQNLRFDLTAKNICRICTFTSESALVHGQSRERRFTGAPAGKEPRVSERICGGNGASYRNRYVDLLYGAVRRMVYNYYTEGNLYHRRYLAVVILLPTQTSLLKQRSGAQAFRIALARNPRSKRRNKTRIANNFAATSNC